MQLDGPRLGPAKGGAAKQLVILLHGVGADGEDLIGLAPGFAQVLPDAAFASPNAPHPCDMAPHGYQWFSIQNPDPALRLAQIRASAQIIDAFIDDELARLGLGPEKLALVGFSQGTMMSLFVAPRRKAAIAGVLGYSGRLDSPEALAGEIRARPPVTLIHGDADPLLPVRLMGEARAALAGVGIEVETHVRPGLPHAIDPEGVAIGQRFLKKILFA